MQKTHTLSNGLRIVTEKIDTVKSTTVGLWIEAGSRRENKQNNGITHFIEHMMFKGTKKRSALELAEAIEDVGGQINAFTGKESTCYYIKVLDENLELALDVLSDMLFNSSFSPSDIEKEKGVVIEEINMSEDSPEDVLNDLHSLATWGTDTIAMPILGTKENVSSFTKEDIISYMDENYSPENAVISICGSFKEDEILNKLNKYFGDCQSKTNNRRLSYSTPMEKKVYLHKEKPIEQLHMSLGMKGYPLGEELGYTLTLIGNILGGGSSSILFQKIREELGLCYSIYTYMSVYNKTGTFNIYVGLSPKNAKKAVEVIKEEILRLFQKGISDEMLEKTKNKLKGNYILGLESTSSRMFANGKNLLLLGRVYSQDDIMRFINAIDQEKINRVLKDIISGGIMNAAFVGNTSDLQSVTEILYLD